MPSQTTEPAETGCSCSDELAEVHERLNGGEDRFGRIEKELQVNTEATRRIEANTSDLVEFFQAAQGAFKVLNWIARLAKPVGYIAGALASVAALWAAWKSGVPPK